MCDVRKRKRRTSCEKLEAILIGGSEATRAG